MNFFWEPGVRKGMSRLDSAIRRLIAQRDCLERAAELLDGVPGCILELGLGNGRTYDHLRALFPNREIFVFDRQVVAHPSCVPEDRFMILGDVLETLRTAQEQIGNRVALVHNDVGCGDPVQSGQVAGALARLLAPLLVPEALVMSDQDLDAAAWNSIPLPSCVTPGRYYMWRVAARQDVVSSFLPSTDDCTDARIEQRHMNLRQISA